MIAAAATLRPRLHGTGDLLNEDAGRTMIELQPFQQRLQRLRSVELEAGWEHGEMAKHTLLGHVQQRLRRFHCPSPMMLEGGRALAAFVESLEGECSDRLEQPVSKLDRWISGRLAARQPADASHTRQAFWFSVEAGHLDDAAKLAGLRVVTCEEMPGQCLALQQ